MNAPAEALGMTLPGSAAIPTPCRDRQAMAYLTGKRIVEMVREDLRPSKVLTRAALENAIVVNSAIGGSTNAPIRLNAITRRIGVEIDSDDWEKHGHKVPLLLNLQPAGQFLAEAFYRAPGGVPVVVAELVATGPIKPSLTANGKDTEMAARRSALDASGGYQFPASQTPRQEIQRAIVDELSAGMVLQPALKFQRIDTTFGPPGDNH